MNPRRLLRCASLPVLASLLAPPWSDPAAAPLQDPRPRALLRAQAILLARQADDGRFAADPATGTAPAVEDLRATAWGILALQADGRRGAGDPAGAALARALVWLTARQDHRGRIGLRTEPDWFVDHALATAALAESLGTAAADDVRAAAARAVAAAAAHVERVELRDEEALLWCAAAAHACRRNGADGALGDAAERLRLAVVARWSDERVPPSARAAAAGALLRSLLGASRPGAAETARAAVAGVEGDPFAAVYGLLALHRAAPGDADAAERFADACRSLTAPLIAAQDERPGAWLLPRPPGRGAVDPPAPDPTSAAAAGATMLTLYYRMCALTVASP